MNRTNRPLSVTILACLFIAVGAVGFVGHFRQSLASPSDGIWIELTELLAILCGAFMLRGHNWARWLAIAWMTFHVILSAFAIPAFPIHCVFLAVIAWFLLRPGAARYFRGGRTGDVAGPWRLP